MNKATVKDIGGIWFVESEYGLSPCETNVKAWRLADKINREAMNRQENVHEWSSRHG